MKKETNEAYQKSLNLAIDYINQHLASTIDIKTIASVANISSFHFHRIFKAYIGESAGSYISRLRMEYAAQKLQTSNHTLNQIAEKAGYQNQHSLSKAFKKHFGIRPSSFKNSPIYFNAYPQTQNVTGIELNPEITETESKQLIYIRVIAPYGSKEEYNTAWKKLWKYAKEKGLLQNNSEFIGLSFDDPNITQHKQCRFYACISTNKKIPTEGKFGEYKIQKGKFAVFIHQGQYERLNAFYQAIYFNWLPRANVELRNAIPFEQYLNNPDEVEGTEILTAIYIPIH